CIAHFEKRNQKSCVREAFRLGREEPHGFAVGLQQACLRERGTTMTNRISQAALLLIASFAPVSVSAGTIELSDVRITARATFSSQRVPETSDFDVKVAPSDQLLQAAQALVVEGLPFPNQPNSQNAGFASSAGVVGGVFGVGVTGLHFQNSLPPNRYFASGTWSQTLTNNSDVTQVSNGTISVPAPTIRFFGVGNSFPPGAEP